MKSLSNLYNVESLHSGLGPISERFKQRIIDMANMEKDSHLTLEAIKMVVLMGSVGFFDEEDNRQILSLLMTKNVKSRECIAPYIQHIYQEQFFDKLKDAADQTETEQDIEKYGSLKSFSQMMVHICQLVQVRQGDIEKSRSDEALQHFRGDHPLLHVSDVGIPTAFCTEKERMRFEVYDMTCWINRDYQGYETSAIGSSIIQIGVFSLLDQLSFINVFQTHYRILRVCVSIYLKSFQKNQSLH